MITSHVFNPCSHGKAKSDCEVCAAWESAVYNKQRAEKAELEVKRLTKERDEARAMIEKINQKVKKKEVLQNQEKQRQENERKQEQEKHDRFIRRQEQEANDTRRVLSGIPFCWVCEKEGITSQQFYYNLLMHNKKEELKGNLLNPFSPEYVEEVRKAQKLGEGETLSVISILPIPSNHSLLKKMNYHRAEAARLVGAISICAQCEKEHKLVRPEPKMSLEQMTVLGSIMEPVITDNAKELLNKEAQTN